MSKKLSNEQILQLYKFTRQHYVEHYDLQTELVDHLANGIELQWQANPDLTFQEALNREFKKFGVFGFHDVIAEKQKAMSKKYWKLLWRFFKQWFKWPKMLMTASIALGLFSILRFSGQSNHKRELILGSLMLLFVTALVYFLMTKKTREAKMLKNGKKFMLADMIYNFGGGIVLAYLPLNIAIGLNASGGDWYLSPYFDWLFSLALTGMLLCGYIIFKVLPERAEQLLADTYPEYKLA
ncbi:hypothetical protein [Flagellimonas lutaonensis]|nr:hypothetical protein [Allomuricauda lutaonensis]